MIIFTEVFLPSILVIVLVWWFRLLNKNKEFYNNIPGPPGLPFFGNVFDFRSTTDILDVLMKYTNDYGKTFKLHLGPIRKVLITSDYKFIEFILSTSKILNKSDNYKFLRPWLGTGLLTSDGPKWKNHRKILTPAFHFQILEQFVDIFESNGNRLIQKLEKEVDKASIDIYPFITLFTLDIICESAMGISVNAQENENSDYVRSVQAMCRIFTERSFSILQKNDLTFPLTKNYYRQKKVLNILHRQTNKVISMRRKELDIKRSEPNTQDVFAIKKKEAFLDLILQAKVDEKLLTQEEIREEVDTFMFEGHDTTGSTISFVLFCLANHSDVQRRAFEEQQVLFGDNKNPTPTYSDLQSMKYLEQVIKETLRLYPAVPRYSRKTNKPVEYNGMIIPEGTTIHIFAYAIHRSPEYFEEPEKFNPSRFKDVDGKLPYSFIPFSAGLRNCVGQKYAMLEMKSAISKIIRKFELLPASPSHKLKLASEVVLKSANGVKISLKTR